MEKYGTAPSDLDAMRRKELAMSRERLGELRNTLEKTAAEEQEIGRLLTRIRDLEEALLDPQ